jgi:hypothetical protein
MPDEYRCATCDYWTGSSIQPYGWCDRINQESERSHPLAFVDGMEGGLETLPEFGCVLWEPKGDTDEP